MKRENIKDIKIERTLTEILFILVFCLMTLIVLILFNRIPFLEILELKSLDLRFIIREQLKDNLPSTSDIVLVIIDDETYYKMDRPLILWNEFYIPVLKNIREAGAKKSLALIPSR